MLEPPARQRRTGALLRAVAPAVFPPLRLSPIRKKSLRCFRAHSGDTMDTLCARFHYLRVRTRGRVGLKTRNISAPRKHYQFSVFGGETHVFPRTRR